MSYSTVSSLASPPRMDSHIGKHQTLVNKNVQGLALKAPCGYCNKAIMGLISQGVRCVVCNKNFHKHCLLKAPNDCVQVVGGRTSPALSDHALDLEESALLPPMQPSPAPSSEYACFSASRPDSPNIKQDYDVNATTGTSSPSSEGVNNLRVPVNWSKPAIDFTPSTPNLDRPTGYTNVDAAVIPSSSSEGSLTSSSHWSAVERKEHAVSLNEVDSMMSGTSTDDKGETPTTPSSTNSGKAKAKKRSTGSMIARWLIYPNRMCVRSMETPAIQKSIRGSSELSSRTELRTTTSEPMMRSSNSGSTSSSLAHSRTSNILVTPELGERPDYPELDNVPSTNEDTLVIRQFISEFAQELTLTDSEGEDDTPISSADVAEPKPLLEELPLSSAQVAPPTTTEHPPTSYNPEHVSQKSVDQIRCSLVRGEASALGSFSSPSMKNLHSPTPIYPALPLPDPPMTSLEFSMFKLSMRDPIIEKAPFFHPLSASLTQQERREYAAKRLEAQENGSWLLRSSHGAYILVVKYRGNIKNVKINHSPANNQYWVVFKDNFN
eukprot:Ihof_evm7s141 gene=Ihof_evmTU7s141